MSARGKPNVTGRSSGKMNSRTAYRNVPPGEQFVALTRKLINSPALMTLTKAAFQVLFVLIEEDMAHGATDNGNLKTTYRQFESRGVCKHQIADALDLLEQVGLVVATRHGMRAATTYRLTFLGTTDAPPTNEWKRWTVDSKPEKRRTPTGKTTP